MTDNFTLEQLLDALEEAEAKDRQDANKRLIQDYMTGWYNGRADGFKLAAEWLKNRMQEM